MSDITISIPDTMKEYVDAQLASGTYANATDFFNHLLREDQKRRAKDHLKAMIREAEASGEPGEITPGYWEDVEKTFQQRHGQGIDAKLLAALDGSESTEMTKSDWDEIRTEVKRCHSARLGTPL